MNMIARALPVLLFAAACGAACARPADTIAGEEPALVAEAPATPEPEPEVAAPNPVVETPEPAPEPAPPEAASGAALLAYLTGDIDPANDPAFKRIPEKYLDGPRVWGHGEAVDALVRMADAAAADGVTLKAVSAFRSFRDQKRIWENKWNGTTLVEGGKLPQTVPDPGKRALKILEFSSMPATSRHHWGTDFDLNNLNNSWFASGKGKTEYDWLVAHAADFGFCQPYIAKGADRSTGYEEEKWHWSYLPVAKPYLAQYPSAVGYDHITGFAGSDAAAGIGVIANYVQGINPECKP